MGQTFLSAQRETATRNLLLAITRERIAQIATAIGKARRLNRVHRLTCRRVLQHYKIGKFIDWSVNDGR